MKSESKKSSRSMNAIKYSETVKCHHHNYGCNESSCPLNILHVPQESCFAIHDIPSERCFYTLDMIANQKLDVAIRNWVEDVFVKRKRIDVPPQITELLKGKLAKETNPSSSPSRIMDCMEWPPDITD